MAVFSPRDLWYALGLSGILTGTLLLGMAGYYLLIEPMRRRQRVMERLEEAREEHLRRVQILKEEMESQDKLLVRILNTILGKRHLSRLQNHLLQGDIYWTPGTFIMVVVGFASAGFLAGAIILNLAWGLLLASVLAYLPYLYLKNKKKRKTLLFEQQMPDAMEVLSRSLRAGHTMPSAIELLSKEMEHPMGSEMRIAYEEQRFGISIPESLIHMLERVQSDDLRYFVIAVVIQHETGGNLVELIDRIAHVVRSRLNFKAKIRAFTAEGRLSATVLIVLPVVLFLLLLVIKNDYEGVLLKEAMGHRFLLIAVILLLGGAYVMRRIIRSVEL